MVAAADVIVVGSGPLGISAARRSAEHGRSVLVLEQGPAISDPPGSHLRNDDRFRADPDAYLNVAFGHLEFVDDTLPRDRLPGAAVTRARGVQGVLWTNYCPRGDAPWPAQSSEQWDAYYRLAEGYLGVEADAVEASVRHQGIRARLHNHLAPQGREVSALPFATHFGAGDNLHYAAAYDILAGTAHGTPAIRFADAVVDHVVVQGSRAVGVSVGGEMLRAQKVIVAAGAIGTPQLLHRSGIRPPALGRWLSYHPILLGEFVLDEELCALPGVADRPPRLQVRPTDEAEWYALVLHDVTPFRPSGPDATIDRNRLSDMQCLIPVDVDERKGIFFDERSRPSFDVPLSAADEARLADATADMDRVASLLGRYRDGCKPQWVPFGFGHIIGTTRMSEADDGTGVADYDGRVWGFDNLYLATNGLFPARMAVNPTLTGVALSIWVADRLVGA